VAPRLYKVTKEGMLNRNIVGTFRYPGNAVQKKRKKDTALKIGVACAAVVLTLGVCEVAVRLVEPVADTKGVRLEMSDRHFGLPKNSRGFAGGVEYKTNSLGFRGRDLNDLDPTPDDIILVLGDSYAFGYGVSLEESFPFLLEEDLSRKYPHLPTKVINLGIPGYNTAQELATLREATRRLRPNLVLIAYHLNDIQTYFQEHGARDLMVGRVVYAVKNHVHLLRFILPRIAGLLRWLGIKVKTTVTTEIEEYVDGGAAWRGNQQTLKAMFQYSRAIGARVGVIVVPYVVQLDEMHPAADAYRAVVMFCESEHIPVVNAFDYFRGRDAQELWINVFDGHPNAHGHRLIAKAAEDLISEMRWNVSDGKRSF
jgi:lysophospholipase L1-like esterase